MKRSTFLNGYSIFIFLLMVALDVTACVLTFNPEYSGIDLDTLWIITVLLNVMGSVSMYVLMVEVRDERQQLEDLRNECELNALENQSPEC